MRTRIEVTFTAGTRSIDTGITDLTIEDIRLIVNETQKKVLCSSMQKDLITSVTNGVVTYVSTLPVIESGDDITFEIDKGEDYPAVAGLVSEIASGKQAIASAINAKGGEASATESFAELAEAVEEIPNFSDMVKLAGIIAGGNYDKNALQGHNENVKYGKTEIVDNVGAFETFSTSNTFKYWDLIKKIEFPYWRTQKTTQNLRIFSYAGDGQTTSVTLGLEEFPQQQQLFYYSRIRKLYMPNMRNFISGYYDFCSCLSLFELELGTLTQMSSLNISGAETRNIKIGIDTNIDLPFQFWTATSVIAEGQSGIDELNANLYSNLLTKLYDHSQDGQTRTLRIGWLANVTAENIAYANAKGWTLTT